MSEFDIIQAKALRMCLGGVRTSPVCALQVTAGEMPLWLRRKQLLANYWVNLMGQREDHPVRVATQGGEGGSKVVKLWMDRGGSGTGAVSYMKSKSNYLSSCFMASDTSLAI